MTGETVTALLLHLKRTEVYNATALVEEVSANIRDLEGRCQEAIGVQRNNSPSRFLRKERPSSQQRSQQGVWCLACQHPSCPVVVNLDDDDAELSTDSTELMQRGEVHVSLRRTAIPTQL